MDTWLKEGEQLIDMRRVGEFQGEGKLLKQTENLKKSWSQENEEGVSSAMKEFVKEYCNNPKKWLKENFSRKKWDEWLYSTKHIKIRYDIKYDGTSLSKLSPGTRGVVLLLLYLLMDQDDLQPLVIDQPEDNLDPKSISDILVKCFGDARERRQIIMVTHNANLVVNTDADQIIVASRGEATKGGLPKIKYVSGGLENSEIREQICEILEGGEEAFRNRARRLYLINEK
jgi:ABC-type Mn2+/Zn2+ transport system ATPase subunit